MAKSAALWLCQRCSVKPEDLGFDPDYGNSLKFFTAPPGVAGTVSAAQPAAGPRGPSADKARDRLRIELQSMMWVSLEWHEIYRDIEPKDRHDALHKAIKITTGVGKSRAIRRMIARFVRRAKLRGLPHRVLYLVGTHKLAAEARLKMPDGVTTAIWQGRDAIKLGTVDEKMCLNPEAVKAAIDIGAVIEETACRKARRGEETIYCPLYSLCNYQAQKALAGKAEGVCGARALFGANGIGEDFGLVVIDEASGRHRRSREAAVTTVWRMNWMPGSDYLRQPARPRHQPSSPRSSCCNPRWLNADGYVTRRQLIDAGLLAATAWENGSCAQAAKWNGRAKPTWACGLTRRGGPEEGGKEVWLHQANTQAPGNVEGA